MSVQIESLLQERAESLEKRWESLERAASREDCFFEKASATLERLKTFCREGDENLDICMFLQLYAQTVLDITYFEENTLVDGNFPEDSSLEQVTDIINILSEPENLIKLLKDREFLKEGISYLLTMLNVKCPVKLEGGVSFQDLNTATLLSQGVFSDTHLLAMMYAGEMCYWILKHCEGKETPQCNVSDAETSKDKGDSFQKDTLDFQDIGEKMLLKYVSVCEGPLKGQGWSTENAIEILDFLKKIGN
ncbi:RAB7A-interacting MON1-CCZ1 complex subunit 1 isoform X2 [Pleurodeles waltl]|uniref:RAB7A-interacting MON1-CCZ1 complex subunit 1 isoform X2 n=1 Tax=Pleurodeles waltl TaxID=8319 RepID=UPI003709B162